MVCDLRVVDAATECPWNICERVSKKPNMLCSVGGVAMILKKV